MCCDVSPSFFLALGVAERLSHDSDKGGCMTKVGSWKTVFFVGVCCLVTAIASPAQTFTSLARFDWVDGSGPTRLVQGTDGNFYGVTGMGGPYGSAGTQSGGGTIFKITPAGSLTTIYSFCPHSGCADGQAATGGLLLGKNGEFYGVTSGGGANGDGTVFEVTPGGKLTTLHSFDGADGISPTGPLIQAANGRFYGTTALGGTSGYGTFFEITEKGELTTLYSFCVQPGCMDGEYPVGSLVQATNGNFYGTTECGGTSSNCPGGCGTVFEITPSGTLTTLHNFDVTDGSTPQGELVQATDGSFYGTALYGANYAGYCELGCGTVFKLSARGVFTTLHIFDYADGANPASGLIQGTDSKFYGTTVSGGADHSGTVFEITAEGAVSTLHSFNGTDGYFVWAGLLQATDGKFYGTSAYGTVFSLDVGLGPFIKVLPTAGRVEEVVTILGNDLEWARRVTFDGREACFRVISSTEIEAVVPHDAKTGYVEVITPQRHLKSNVEFRVAKGDEGQRDRD